LALAFAFGEDGEGSKADNALEGQYRFIFGFWNVFDNYTVQLMLFNRICGRVLRQDLRLFLLDMEK